MLSYIPLLLTTQTKMVNVVNISPAKHQYVHLQMLFVDDVINCFSRPTVRHSGPGLHVNHTGVMA